MELISLMALNYVLVRWSACPSGEKFAKQKIWFVGKGCHINQRKIRGEQL